MDRGERARGRCRSRASLSGGEDGPPENRLARTPGPAAGRYRKGIPMGIQHAERGIALLRIVVGFWFLKAGVSHIAFTPMPWVSARWAEIMPKIVEGNAKEHPIAFYKAFLENVVLPNSTLFASLSGIGEFLVGVSLTLGILSGLGGLGGLFLAAMYG